MPSPNGPKLLIKNGPISPSEMEGCWPKSFSYLSRVAKRLSGMNGYLLVKSSFWQSSQEQAFETSTYIIITINMCVRRILRWTFDDILEAFKKMFKENITNSANPHCFERTCASLNWGYYHCSGLTFSCSLNLSMQLPELLHPKSTIWRLQSLGGQQLTNQLMWMW